MAIAIFRPSLAGLALWLPFLLVPATSTAGEGGAGSWPAAWPEEAVLRQIEETKLTASDAAKFDHFGSSVSISGDALLVGARRDHTYAGFDSGSAYVYRLPPGPEIAVSGACPGLVSLTLSGATPNGALRQVRAGARRLHLPDQQPGPAAVRPAFATNKTFAGSRPTRIRPRVRGVEISTRPGRDETGPGAEAPGPIRRELRASSR